MGGRKLIIQEYYDIIFVYRLGKEKQEWMNTNFVS